MSRRTALTGTAPAPKRALPPIRARHLLVAGAVAASALAVSGPGPTRAQSPERACQEPSRRITLYAEQLPSTPEGEIRLGWGLTPDTAQIPGPLIEMIEGECLAITVVNDIPEATLAALRDDPRLGSGDPTMPLGVSLHVHGVKYTRASDGTLVDDFASGPSIVPPGAARTFTWFASPRVVVAGRVVSVGTAGYWWYHDHVIGTPHGTGGIASGLFGGLVVRRPGDLRPDRSFTVVMGPRQTINLRRYPDTDTCDLANPVPGPTCFVAREGERVEFLVLGVGDEFHTFHLHGHNWADTRTGSLAHQLDEAPLIDTKTVGPAETFGFQVVAGEGVGPGKWMMHCHVQLHSDLGMVTFFNVLPGSGIPSQGQGTVAVPHHHGRPAGP